MPVYSIPAGAAFLDILAHSLLAPPPELPWLAPGDPAAPAGRADPLALTRITVLLPTRRAVPALQAALLRAAEGRPLLLPRLLPLGDLSPDDLDDGAYDAEVDVPTALDGIREDEPDHQPAPAVDVPPAILPPAIDPVARQVLLARALLRIDADRPIDQALHLARDLARLIDLLHTERVDPQRLDTLAPEDLAHHWQRVLAVLRIVTQHWPALVAADGAMDPAARRNAALAAWAQTWTQRPPSGPVIVAGSTGSVPATADLLAVVAGLPRGAVILPGLDRSLPDDAWAAVAEAATHPQHGLALLLARLGLHRAAVPDWPGSADPPSTAVDRRARRALLRAALLPAAALGGEVSGGSLPALGDPLAGLRVLDCPGPEQEAQAIAVLLREALETPGRTAALVTPDRTLARRVAAALGRWQLGVDDSAGTPLATTPPAVFLRLLIAMAVEDLAPVSLLAALNHPLAGAGGGEAERATFRADVRLLERCVLRGLRPAPGAAGLRAACESARARLGNRPERDWSAARDARDLAAFVPRLVALLDAAAPLLARVAERSTRLDALVGDLLALAETLASPEVLWAGDAGNALAASTAAMLESGAAMGPMPGGRFGLVLEAFLAGQVIRPVWGGHPRLFLWGPLEARLQTADLMVLGGLNEGSWPADPRPDPWLSRSMRRALGLSPPERQIGLAAHDFVQAASAPEVVITRAAKLDGAQTRPARWLQRLDAQLEAAAAAGHPVAPERLRAGPDVLGWAEALDRPPAGSRPATVPARPPLAARPRRLSVTEIETWHRDPYAIYARRILRLEALAPIDQAPDAALRGTLIHAVLERFTRAWPTHLPPDPEAALLTEAEAVFAGLGDRPGIRAFWWPRIRRIAAWVAETEPSARTEVARIVAECSGRMEILPASGLPFVLTAKADRIALKADGSAAILDYKTGAVPSKRDIEIGLAPQLPLQALILAHGGFDGLPAADSQALDYWKLSGGATAGKIEPAAPRKGIDVADLIATAERELRGLIERFDNEAEPYPVCPDPDRAPRHSDYVHLERRGGSLDDDEPEVAP